MACHVTGAITDDFYHLYPGDIAIMQQLGAKHLRISISWSRILPTGDGDVNQPGLEFYSALIDALLAAGIEPHVTVYHWDLPQVVTRAVLGPYQNPALRQQRLCMAQHG